MEEMGIDRQVGRARALLSDFSNPMDVLRELPPL